MIHAKWADSWRQIYTPYVNITGAWKRIKAAWTKVDGSWKQIYTECPAYFSVPNVSSSPTTRGYGTIFTPDFGIPTMHNRNVTIPSKYLGYSIVGWTATMGFTMFNMDTASSSQYNVTSGMTFTNGANARTLHYAWTALGSTVGYEGSYPVSFSGYYVPFMGWYRWSYGSAGEGDLAYYQNYFTTTVTQAMTALPITSTTLNIHAFAVNHGRDWGLACYWQNMKLTLQNPHTGDTVALSFV